ncbi:hypothetical protein OE88DRAFT_1653027 [Heliocybe sulcata]|uniref:Uncharacterized protein n=1 Tax=Heliocybe sulcata TaxID=5364 RepID=A0A5C3NB92_9AGAM|nr:hypothetical protein OE88DRAFT_1653027 [Heliocybe sulcata]
MPRKTANLTDEPKGKPMTRRNKTSTAAVTNDDEDIMHVEEAGDIEEDAGGDDSVGDMLTMLQELQKRKAAKSSTGSAVFQSQKKSMYAEARRNGDLVVQEGVAYIQQCKEQLKELKSQESSYDIVFPELMQMWKAHDEAVHSLLSLYPPFFDDLSQRRSEEIDAASSMLEAHEEERVKSRRRLMKKAKARLDEGLENQKIATDASALIKHYKSLLRS